MSSTILCLYMQQMEQKMDQRFANASNLIFDPDTRPERMDKAPASALLVVCLCLLIQRVKVMSVCGSVEYGCHFLSVSDLFDRVIQHSSRLHSLSTDLYLDLEKYFLPDRNDLDRTSQQCPTSVFQTPNGKENAQKIPREELTHLILSLLRAWKEPLSQFHQNFETFRGVSESGQRKAQEISSMVTELETGVEKVTARMQSMGIMTNLLNGMTSSSSEAMGFTRNEDTLMNAYELLHCFRRDSNKVQSYLNILKCSTVPENSC